MKKLWIILLVGFCFAVAQESQAKTSFGIAATVNEDAISEADLYDRMRLIFASSGMPDTKETRRKIRPQALDNLIDEQLKIQEARRNNMEVTQEEIDAGFAAMAGQNNMNPEEFSKVMAGSGIPASTLMRKIESQIAWQKVIAGILRPRIDINEKEVQAKINRIKEKIGNTEYQVSEIFLPVQDSKEEAKVKEMGTKLIGEIKKGRAPFAMVAAQFSKSASAQQGGSIGWVQAGELPKEQDVVVKSLSKGQISSPIKTLSGYHILTVTDIRQVSEETLPSEDDVLNAIGLKRLDRLQKRHLADLHSASFIDRRDVE